MTQMAVPDVEPKKVELVLSQFDCLTSLPAPLPELIKIGGVQDAPEKVYRLLALDPRIKSSIDALILADTHGGRGDAEVEVESLRLLAIALGLLENLRPDAHAKVGQFDFELFARQCLATACAARSLARAHPCGVRPYDAFALGLIHDLGKPALNLVMPRSFDKALRRSVDTHADLIDAERAVMGVDHAEVGRYLALGWGLPSGMVDCISLHYHPLEAIPARSGSHVAVRVVQLAEAIAREHVVGCSENHGSGLSAASLAEQLSVSPEAIAEIASGLPEDVRAATSCLEARVVRSHAGRFVEPARSSATIESVQQDRRILSAIDRFHGLLSLQGTVREACAAAAEAIRGLFDVPSALIFTVAPNGKWIESGWSDGHASSNLEELPVALEGFEDDFAQALELARSGCWLSPLPQGLSPVVDRFRGKLGNGRISMVTIATHSQWVAAGLIGGDINPSGGLSLTSADIGTVCSTIAIAILHAQVRAQSKDLDRQLINANRRWSALQPELVRVRALESIAAMAAGAAHELNNPLAVISGRAQLLGRGPSAEQIQAAAETIRRAAESCSNIVSELMEFAQPPTPSPENIDLKSVLESVRAEAIQRGLLAAGDLTVEISPDIPRVRFDAAQLSRLFHELISNAVQASVQGSCRLSVKVTRDPAEDVVVVLVADNGPGMTPDVLGRAFDPFFSFREAGRGRGLGLARVHRWVTAAGGLVRMTSSPGNGTRVELRLPAAGRNDP